MRSIVAVRRIVHFVVLAVMLWTIGLAPQSALAATDSQARELVVGLINCKSGKVAKATFNGINQRGVEVLQEFKAGSDGLVYTQGYWWAINQQSLKSVRVYFKFVNGADSGLAFITMKAKSGNPPQVEIFSCGGK